MSSIERTVAVAVLLLILVACSSSKSLAPSGASLTGQKWQATTIAGKAVSAPAPYITFQDDGHVSGNDGCNTIGGDYKVNGNTISIGPLGGTLMACPDSDTAQEQAFVHIMGGPTVTFTTSADTLNIHSSRGGITFTAAPAASAP